MADDKADSESTSYETFLQDFLRCEKIVENSLDGTLLVSSKKNQLKDCINVLTELSRAVNDLDLISENDPLDDLTANTLRFLLIPVYLGYCFQENGVDRCERGRNLQSAKAYYREFLKSMQMLGIIFFKHLWMDEDPLDDEIKPSSSGGNQSSFDMAVQRRERKIARSKQIDELSQILCKLRLEQTRNDDESTQRELNVVLLRLWSIRALNELDLIQEELDVLKYMADNKDLLGSQSQTNQNEKASSGIKSFVIQRNEKQKKVFGLGYPSIPTVTVDEWYDEMKKTGGFGKMNWQKGPGFGIGQSNNHSDEEQEDSEVEEERRQRQIKMDKYKDTHRRGWGNTYNKG